MSEVINFQFDVPVEVALRFSEPRIFASKFAGGDDRHMYSTTDGRVMYMTPLASARIKALHLAQAEVFYVCKRKNGRVTEFAVSREPMPMPRPEVAPSASAPRPPAPFKTKLPENLYYKPQAPTPAEPSLEEQLRASIEMANRRRVGEQGDGTLAVMAPPAPRPAVQEPAPAKPSPEPRLAPAVAEFSARLVLETSALVDCYASVLRSSSEKHGNAVKPEDVRSLLVTAYINSSKSGGRSSKSGGRNAA